MAFNLYGGGFTSSTSTEESPQGAASSFQLYDRNGSNLTFANDHTQFNSMYNHVHRVLGDHHDITETNKEVRVRGNYNTFTEQDMFITIGNWTKEAMDASEELQQIINEAMEAKSATGGGGGGGEGRGPRPCGPPGGDGQDRGPRTLRLPRDPRPRSIAGTDREGAPPVRVVGP